MKILSIISLFLMLFSVVLLISLYKLPAKKKASHLKVSTSNLQLLSVLECNFQKQLLLNKSEAVLHKLLNRFIAEKELPLFLFSQVSLGEILKSNDRTAFFAINSKRVDFLITDYSYSPLAVIEYQGSGHYKGNAKVRDEIKRTACEKASVVYLELKSDFTEADIVKVFSSIN